jgi:hypothetical protein
MIYSSFVLGYAAGVVMTFLIKGLTATLLKKGLSKNPW